MMRFAIKTLGCKVNQYEEQVLRENLVRFGFREAGVRDADIVIVNSCTVTAQADRKTRKIVQKIKKENPGVKIFVTGCLAVLEEDIENLRSLPEVHAVVPGSDKARIPLILDDMFGGGGKKAVKEEVSGFSSHTRAFLKIQDGCDQNCSYCKVSLVRGPSRSRDKRDVLAEVARLADGGYREIVLTGVCLGAWKGGKGESISDLLREIDGLEGDFRIRISSIEPNYIDETLIETIAASGRICRHLHIPLQSGSDRILGSMGRRYTVDRFRCLVGRLRKAVPLIGLTMDVIAGFPGETDADFRRTLEFVRETRPSRLHVFKYSDRKGTPASLITEKVPLNTAKSRVEWLIGAGYELQAEFCAKFVGREVDVLLERRPGGSFLEGYTGEYLRARLEGFEGPEGDIMRIKVNHVDENSRCLIARKTENSIINASC